MKAVCMYEDADLSVLLARMARDLLSNSSLDSTLDTLVSHAVEMVDGCESSSIMVLDRKGYLTTLAATDEIGPESNRIQRELGEGPCFDVGRQKLEILRVADMGASGDKWPSYAPKARALGIGSMMGLLLLSTKENLGMLNMYSSQVEAFTQRSEKVGWVFASHASFAFASARNDAQLHEAISTRQGIGEALGVLMHRHELDRHQAFEVLKKASQKRNVKLRDIAAEVVETRQAPPETERLGAGTA